MNEWAEAVLVGAAVVVVVLAPLLALSRCLPDRLPPEYRAAGLSERLRAEGLEADVRSQYWPAGWPHEAPERRLSVVEAHQATQRHRECDALVRAQGRRPAGAARGRPHDARLVAQLPIWRPATCLRLVQVRPCIRRPAVRQRSGRDGGTAGRSCVHSAAERAADGCG